MENFALPLIKKEEIAEGSYSFYFDRTRHDLNFLPGQYVRMILPIEDANKSNDSRFFTIASSPLEKNYIMITTKITKSAFKKKLLNLNVGENVQFFGSLGGFVLKEDESFSRVFLAGGIGVTPFYSMINYVAQKHLNIPIFLFVSFSTTQEIFWLKEFSDITTNNQNIKVVYTVTRPEESKDSWEGEGGRISEDLIGKYVKNALTHNYYIAGPPSMVEAMERVVEDMGVDSEKIRIENFTGY